MALLDYQGPSEGTEATVSFTEDGETSWGVGDTAEKRVRVQDMEKPYYSLHSHASNAILSPEDVLSLIRHDNMRGIGAVGNKGALFACEKVFGFDRRKAFGWYETL